MAPYSAGIDLLKIKEGFRGRGGEGSVKKTNFPKGKTLFSLFVGNIKSPGGGEGNHV